jgi:hypothetical protein
MSTIVDICRSGLRRQARTIPEICAAIQWKLPPGEVGRGIRELIKQGKAEYSPIQDGQCSVPGFRKVGPA